MTLLQTEKIRKYRYEKSFSQEFMAHKMGIGQSTYQKIESGETKISVERLMEIAAILEQPFEKFLNTEHKLADSPQAASLPINGTVAMYADLQVELLYKIIDQQEKRIAELEAKIQRRDKKIEELKEMVGLKQ
jgi:transcriptional regulator with XRE-family HTH domain